MPTNHYLTRLLSVSILASTLPLMHDHASAQEISPRSLVEVADLTSPVVAPDGKKVAFRLEQASVQRNTYDTWWYVNDVDGDGPPRRVADGGVLLRDSAGTPLPVNAVWSPDGRWIYFRAMVEGKLGVWRAAANGSRTERLTSDPADIREFALSEDGSVLTFSVGPTRDEVLEAEESEYDRGVRIDESVPIGQPLFRSGNLEGRLATQRYGPVWFTRAPLLADTPNQWKALDLRTGKVEDLAAANEPEAPIEAAKLLPKAWALARDDSTRRVALLTRVGESQRGEELPVELVMLPDGNGMTSVRCQAKLCTNKAITGIQWRPNSDEVLFTITDPQAGLAQSIYRWNVQTGAVSPITDTIGQLSGGRDGSSPCGLSSEVLICVSAAADRPPRLERVDLATGRRHVLFDPNASLAATIKERAPARLLSWVDAKGRPFTGQFFPAANEGPTPPPLFIAYYRCAGFLRGGVGDEWPLASLAESGIAALCINNPPGFLEDGVERYDLALEGVKSAIDVLAAEGQINRARIGMGGLSFGTEVTLWTAMNSDLLTALSVASPVRTPNHYLFSSLKGEVFFSGFKRFWQLGSPEDTADRWRVLSPAYNIDKFRAPILMQIPEQEYIISLEYAIPLMHKNMADLHVFPHEPHQKFQPRHKEAVYQRNIDWFRFWLQGFEYPDAERSDQYAYWRKMKMAKK